MWMVLLETQILTAAIYIQVVFILDLLGRRISKFFDQWSSQRLRQHDRAAVRPHFNGQWDDYRMLRHRVIFNSSTSVLSRRSQRSVQASLGRLWCVTIRNRVVRLCYTPLNIWALPGFREGTSHQYLLTIRSVDERQLLDIRSINSRSNGWMGVAKVQVRVSSSATHHGCRWSSVIHARNSFHRRECQLILKNYKKRIFYGSTMLGPALGYIAGGQLLRLYVDFDTISANEVGMAPGSSGWIGAWWLGFVIAGTLLCIAAIPLLAFPGELLGAKALAAAKEAEHSKTEDPEDDDDYDSKNDSKSTTPDGAISVGQSLRELPLAIKELATRWTFLFICLEQSCEAMLLAGFGAFLPKIIESQFSLSPAMAAIIVGGLVIPCGCGASYSGGYLIKHYRMRPRTILKMSCFLVSLSFIFSLAFMVYCPNQDFAGVTIPYSGKHELKIVSDCNAKCSCSLDTYDPICGIDNILYYSPCHAGCTSSHETLVNGSKSFAVYSNCSCITSPEYKRMKVMGGAEIDVMAARQTCTSAKCNHQLYLFTILLFLFLALVFMNSMPILSATLRSVPYNRRAFALGTQMIIWRLLGAIPGPMIFGLFIDSSCVLWSHTNNECGDNSDNSGSCLIYNNYSFSRAMVGLALVVKGFTFLFATLSWWFYTPSTVTKASNGVQEVAATSANPEAKTKEIYAYDNTAVDRNE
ncbi:solute carrier organic anion transporter family member 4A1-like isoform X2 [Daphnia pulex]|uniref:solute carrier organic anion transporter family member 4A1-like isoform X2 n=1 Tax=Daphnia pulex TaxID=6669 RepID=UPI001EDFDB77|nr:solute carrier organic anion transporter family member 4A1-like isoform X2 [Daphnia pulex]